MSLTDKPLYEALLGAAVVTAVVTLCSAYVPDKFVATAVGLVFLGATWFFVWRKDDRRVEAMGLTLGGIVFPGRVDRARLVKSTFQAIGWAALCAAIFFVPFYFGWRHFWHPRGHFHVELSPSDALNEVFGQVVIIALPEEAFYRGYLQSRLDEAFPAKLRVLGADIGLGLPLTCAIFAIGHIATIHQPARLAVFFPALVFGWLRARTKGIGAGVAFHASCNLFSEALGRGFRVY